MLRWRGPIRFGYTADQMRDYAQAVADEINRQWMARLESVTTGNAGTVLMDGAIVCCNEHDREPCPSQPERRCKDCPGNATLYRIAKIYRIAKEQ